ncbi:transposase [Chitinophaga sancti]|uniref:transposase n=1 Tax=Chitinophaga sancti TaxID=1004 RepID=UPI002A76381E|nr:transposase [Chitinophaga sancti]WPQ63358.1 transposase [Chitinophaga sancti]
MAQRKTYSKEFKAEALRLAETSGVTQVSQDLGIHPNMLYVWKKQLDKGADKALPGRGNPTDPELAQLRKDNARLKEEVEILKKAAGIFLNRSGKDTQ